MKLILVVAGNVKQFYDGMIELAEMNPDRKFEFNKGKNWAKLGDTEYVYCADADRMRGYHGVQVYFWGTVVKRADYDDLVQQAMIARMP